MTTVGHSLTALSLGALLLPPSWSLTRTLTVGQFLLLAANLPDFPLPGWGHARYEVSHSLFVAIAATAPIHALCLAPGLRPWLPPIVPAAITLAWLSHPLLDSLYNHGRGIAIFWPFSDAHLALPLPWFQTLTMPPFTPINLRVFGIEALFYGALLAGCLWLRARRVRAVR